MQNLDNSFCKKVTKSVIFYVCIVSYCFLGVFIFAYIENCENNWKDDICQSLKAINVKGTKINDTFADSYENLLRICNSLSCEKLQQQQQQQQQHCHYDINVILKWANFCWTTVTTIGYGSIVPKTSSGKLLIIPYSAFGIALVLAFLGSTGSIVMSINLKCIAFLEKDILKIEHVYYKRAKVLCLTIFSTSVCLATNVVVYSYLSEVDLITSLYFIYVTFTTIGFDDYDYSIVMRYSLQWVPHISIMNWMGLIGISTLVQAMVDLMYKNSRAHPE